MITCKAIKAAAFAHHEIVLLVILCRKEPKIKDFLRVHWLQVPPSQSWVTKWVTTKIGARKRPPFLAFLSDKPAPKR